MGVRQATQAVREARVLAAARLLFAEKGYERTSVKDIAREAGVSVGTVANTGDKASLLRRQFDENETVALLGRLAALEARPPVCLADEVTAVFDEWFDSIAEDEDLVRDYCMAILAQNGVPARASLDESIMGAIARRVVAHHPAVDPRTAADLALGIYSTSCMLVVSSLIGSQPLDQARARLAGFVHTLTDQLSAPGGQDAG